MRSYGMMVPFIKHSNRTWPFQWERPLQMDAMEELTHCQIRWGGGPTSQPLWDGFRFIKDMIQKMGSDGLLINISSVTHIIKRLNVASIYIYIQIPAIAWFSLGSSWGSWQWQWQECPLRRGAWSLWGHGRTIPFLPGKLSKFRYWWENLVFVRGVIMKG